MDKNIVSFDVRSLIAGGTDPFKEIMSTIAELEEGQTLEIINSFEPIPLINVLKSKGFSYEVLRKGQLVHTFFQKGEKSENGFAEASTCSSTDSFDQVYKTYIGKMKYVDVRHMEMPEPMTTILEELEQLPSEFCLLVDHKKIPQFLLPELKQRNFDIYYNELSVHHIQLLIRKSK